MSDNWNEAEFWGALAACLLHPTRLEIIEAMLWIDRPLSPAELAQVFFEATAMSSVAYHVRCLKTGGVLKVVRRRQVRGTVQTRYRLDPRPTLYKKRRSRGH